ncbi:MAG: D-alanine--D-alanine ligase [Anaerolineales bacterium]
MKIGLTFDLAEEQQPGPGAPPDACAEFDTEESIGYLEGAIAGLGYEVRRIGNLQALLHFLLQGESVDLVFNMAEGSRGRSREAQVPALLEAHGIPYTGSDPLTLALCLDKAMAKRVWQRAGLPTPDFAVVPEAGALGDADLPPFPLFVKPLHEGTSKGIDPGSVVHSAEVLGERVAWIVETYRQPALVEAFLPGREFSVGILGSGTGARVIGVTEIRVDSVKGIVDFREKQSWDGLGEGVFVPLAEGSLRQRLADLALRAYRVLECRDLGRVDLRLDAQGEPALLELNPIVGLHPLGSVMPILARQAGMSFDALVASIIDQALCRSNNAGNGGGHYET